MKVRKGIILLMTFICFFSQNQDYTTQVEEIIILNRFSSDFAEQIMQEFEDLLEFKLEDSKIGYLTAKVNVRANANINADIIDVYDINTQIEYEDTDDEDWVRIIYVTDEEYMWGYIYKEYIQDEELTNEQLIEYQKEKGILVYLGKFKITHYCACSICCGKNDGITATGTMATINRTIAVDPDVISYGTQVVIGNVIYIAEDCGGGINGYQIDIYCSTHEEALEKGVYYTDVYIYVN